MDDDYLNVYKYVGEEKHEYTAATNISKEEHEMKKMASPQEVKIHQQTQVNPSSTDTHGFQKQAQEGGFKKTTKGIIFTLLITGKKLAYPDTVHVSSIYRIGDLALLLLPCQRKSVHFL